LNNYSNRYSKNRKSNSNQQRNFRPQRQQSAPRRIISADEKKFLEGIPVDPSPRIILEQGSSELTMRAMDLICPIGMGQRGLIVAPPGSGKTTFLKHLCHAITKSTPEMKVYVLLIDERPEEVTDFRREVQAEVRWSSMDQEFDNHIKVADQVMTDAFKEVAEGKNVTILIDSLTRLSRVHNAGSRSGGKTLSGGVDSRAMEVPRRIFGAARNIENGGSLTILASILIETGSRMDEVIFEEFKGTGNMEIVLSRDIANYRIFPAIDVHNSSTRKSELLFNEEQFRQLELLRRGLAGLNKMEAIQKLIELIKKYPTNDELLATFTVNRD
jgi:transcription termination factor Rho